MKRLHALALIPLLAACQSLELTRNGESEGASPSSAPWTLRPQARGEAGEGAEEATAQAADGITNEAPATQAMATGRLGLTIATLGTATEQGLWLKTPLVGQTQMGRVRASSTGQEIAVQLIPTGGEPGSGSRLSLQAMQRLGLPLTALAEVEVFGG